MQQIAIWQDPHNKILELTKKIEELEKIADPKRNLIKQQTDKVQALELVGGSAIQLQHAVLSESRGGLRNLERCRGHCD